MLMNAQNQELPETSGVLNGQENPELEEMLRLDQEQEVAVSQTDSMIDQANLPSEDQPAKHQDPAESGQTDSEMKQDQAIGEGTEGDFRRNNCSKVNPEALKRFRMSCEVPEPI